MSFNSNVKPPTHSFDSLIQRDVKGTLFYPMSGADITPILICPNVDTFVFVDEHLLLNIDDEKATANTSFTSADQFVDQRLVDLIISGMKHYNAGCDKFPLSFPMFMTGNPDDIQYDFTSPFALLVRADILSMKDTYAVDCSSKGLIHLLAMRIKDRTNFDVKAFEIIKSNLVYKFTLMSRIDGSQKTLWYVKANFSEPSSGYEWLLAQQFTYSTILIKGYPYYANFQNTPEYIAKTDALKRSILQVCAESVITDRNTFRLLTDQKEAPGQFADPLSKPQSENQSVSFGYGTNFSVYGVDSVRNFVLNMKK